MFLSYGSHFLVELVSTRQKSICYHTLIYCLFLHCHLPSCYPWCWTWEAFLMDQVLGEICCFGFLSFLKFCTLCWMYFFFLNRFGHTNSGTEFYCLLTVPFFSWIKRRHVYCDVKVTLLSHIIRQMFLKYISN